LRLLPVAALTQDHAAPIRFLDQNILTPKAHCAPSHAAESIHGDSLHEGPGVEMKFHQKFHHIVSAAAILLCTSTASLAAPAGLLNKSIHISYGAYIPGRTADGRINRSGRKVSLTLYVSSAGRIFFTGENRAGHFGRDFKAAPERTARGFHFAGSTLVGAHAARFGNIAAQLKVSFDSSFQTCSANVIVGGTGGAPISWIGLDGERYTATGHPNISDVACSVQNGNAFAN